MPHLGGPEIDITAALVQATGAENLVVDVTAEELKRREQENARLLEDHLLLMNAINNGGLGRYFYRDAKPGEL